MTDPTAETHRPETSCTTRRHWPDDPIDMMAEMMCEQANHLNALFRDMLDCSARAFDQRDPVEAEAYVRLALKANANARSSMEAIARARHASRRVAVAETKI